MYTAVCYLADRVGLTETHCQCAYEYKGLSAKGTGPTHLAALALKRMRLVLETLGLVRAFLFPVFGMFFHMPNFPSR